MDLETRDATAGTLMQQLREATGFPRLPTHILYRLVALVGDRPVVFMDSDVDSKRGGQHQTLHGQIVSFTEALVVLITLDGTTAHPQTDEEATVALRAWARSALVGVEIAPAANSDEHWVYAQHMLWPRGGHVMLSYDGESEALTLPLSPSGGDRLGELLPDLVLDVSR